MMSIISASVYWKLAWRHLKLQKRQTLLTIVGSCIGAALIMATVIFFQSFEHSGDNWLKKHYGPIEWELQPTNAPFFQKDEQTEQIEAWIEQAELVSLPVITIETRAEKVDGQLQVVSMGSRFLAVGFDQERISMFDPGNSTYPLEFASDELIASSAFAAQLGLRVGDVVRMLGETEEEYYFKVKKILPEAGIIGYRGHQKAEGTMIITMEAARQLTNLPKDAFTSYLSRRTDGIGEKPSYFPIPNPPVQVIQQKLKDAQLVDEMKLRFGLTFLICSITAVIAGAILMLQVLLMLADSRKRLFAVLRAIGYQRGQIQRIFLIEAAFIQGASLLVGLAVGIPIGYGTIALFQGLNGDLMQAYGGKVIPITPHVSLSGVVIAGVIVFGLFSVTAILASMKLRKMQIVPALNDARAAGITRPTPLKIAFGIITDLACVAIVILHVLMLINGYHMLHKTAGFINISGFVLVLSWLLTSVSALYLMTRMLPFIQRILRFPLKRLGIEETAQILAFRYPARYTRRSFFTMLIFSCCFMLVVIVTQLAVHIQSTSKQTQYEILGYTGYIAYKNDSAKQHITKLLQEKKELAQWSNGLPFLEPYMVKAMSEDWVLGNNQFNIITPNHAFLEGSDIKLLNRSDIFASDEEAWEAVMTSPQYILLDQRYRFRPEEWSEKYGVAGNFTRAIGTGDKLTIQILPHSKTPISKENESALPVVATIEVTVAGFVENNAGIAFYNGIWVNEAVYQQLKQYGYRWETEPDQGYFFVQYPSTELGALRELEQKFSLMGITTFNAPAIEEGGSQLSLVQMLWIFIGFMIMTMCIGLAGLSIVQLRAVQERSKVMAMLRCIGFQTKTIKQMILLEGTMIGWTGVLNGLIFGTSGGYMIYILLELEKRPTDPFVAYHFSWEIIVPVTFMLLLLTWVLNVYPTKRLLRLSPGEAVRLSEE